jgi:glycosyltransferase involved in cell wall biosynthesis
MSKDNIIIYVSSRNNYDMLSGEVLKNINTEGFEFINVDDKSSEEEIEKGKKICEENDIVFLENESRGVQHATQTLVNFIKHNRPKCKWIFCFQHDCYPITENFFLRFSKLVKTGKLDEFGTVGFNRIDMGKHTPGAYDEWVSGNKPIGHLGLAHLSILNTSTRWIQPNRNYWLNNNDDWRKPHSIEITAWTGFALSIDKWSEFIEPTDEYHFHLWAPDVSIQFLYHNCHNLVLPELYLMNKQELKEKYDISINSTKSAAEGNEFHFGEPNNFKLWYTRWGWDYESPSTIAAVKQHYEGTLIEKFIDHDTHSGPLMTFDLGEY